MQLPRYRAFNGYVLSCTMYASWSLPPIPSRQEEKTAIVVSYFSTPEFPLFRLADGSFERERVSRKTETVALGWSLSNSRKRAAKEKGRIRSQRRPSWFPFDLRICLRIEYRFFFFSTIIISMGRTWRSWFNGIKNGVKIGWRGFYSQGRSVSLPISGKTDRTFALNPTLISPCSSRHFHVFFLPNVFDNMSPRFVSASSVWVWRRIDVARIFGIDLFISAGKRNYCYHSWSSIWYLIIC